MYFEKCREIRGILEDLNPDDQSTLNRFSEFFSGLVTEARNHDMAPMATLHGCLGICARGDNALYSDNDGYKPALTTIVRSVSEVIGGLQAIIDVEEEYYEGFCLDECTVECYVDKILADAYANEAFIAMADAVEAFMMNKPADPADPAESAESAEEAQPQG